MQPVTLAACVGEMPPGCYLLKGIGVPDSRTVAEFPPS